MKNQTRSSRDDCSRRHHAAYMLRIREAAGDRFLKAVSRLAIKGRYANFPNYDINGEYTGMVLSFGAPNTSAYAWFSATGKEVRTARLHYRLGGSEWNVPEHSRYPYDFSLPMEPGDASLSYWIEAAPASGGAAVKSETVELRK